VTRRYPPDCPAQEGGGADITASPFTFVAHDCWGGRSGRAQVTEVFGFFRDLDADGDSDRLNDVLQTCVIELMPSSRLARLARRIAGDPTARPAARVGEMLRVSVLMCPGASGRECPALNRATFVRAMEHAFD